MVKKFPAINLFHGRKTAVDRFIRWSLSAGRIIILLTEVIALSAFLYRFSLDRQIIDLQDKIKQEQKILDFFKENEEKYRNLQVRLTASKHLMDRSESYASELKRITESFSQDMITNSITFSPQKVSVNGSVTASSSLSQLVDKIKEFPGVKGFSIDRIENRVSNGTINFSLNIELVN